MGRIVQFGFLFFLVVAFSNCKKTELNPSVIINVEDDFYIDIFENLDDKVFHITVKSIQQQDCQNALIDYSLDTSDEDQIVISINDIIEPETCIPGNAPAFVSIPIENVEERSYNIQINLKDVINNKGSLTISNTDYFLGMNTENGIELLHKILYKIPKNTIWGYVGYEEENGKTTAESFIKEIEDISTNMNIDGGYDIGYYGYFNILEDRNFSLSSEPEDKFHTSFIFSFDGASQEITAIIDSYCNSNPGINFIVFNEEGEELKCE